MCFFSVELLFNTQLQAVQSKIKANNMYFIAFNNKNVFQFFCKNTNKYYFIQGLNKII